MVYIKQSTNPSKKYMIKVNYNSQTKTVHFGGKNYDDYTVYYKEEGKQKADERKRLYIARHKKDNLNDPFSPGFWSMNLGWSKPTIQESLNDVLRKYPSIKLENI